MRIGLTANGSTVDELVTYAKNAEADGFNSLGSPASQRGTLSPPSL